jgi:hypothetical protein
MEEVLHLPVFYVDHQQKKVIKIGSNIRPKIFLQADYPIWMMRVW